MTVRNVFYANGCEVRTRFLTGTYIQNKKAREKISKKKNKRKMHQNTNTEKKNIVIPSVYTYI